MLLSSSKWRLIVYKENVVFSPCVIDIVLVIVYNLRVIVAVVVIPCSIFGHACTDHLHQAFLPDEGDHSIIETLQ